MCDTKCDSTRPLFYDEKLKRKRSVAELRQEYASEILFKVLTKIRVRLDTCETKDEIKAYIEHWIDQAVDYNVTINRDGLKDTK